MQKLVQNSILVLIGAVAIAGILGSAVAHVDTTQILGFCSVICVSLLGLLQVTTSSGSTASVTDKVAKVEKITVAVHGLVNGAMGLQLKLNAVISKRLASITRDSNDIEVANLADKIYADHQAAQAIIDVAMSAK